MANLEFVKKNRLREEMNWAEGESWSGGTMLFFLGCNLLTGWFSLALLFATIPLTLIIFSATTSSPGYRNYDPLKAAGADGEDYTLAQLSGLPDNYVVLNEVGVLDPTSEYGKREIDFVVIGPGGLYLVECKNYSGQICGGEHDSGWRLNKVGRGGTPYSTTVTNPVRQVRKQAAALRKHLAACGVQVPVLPLVALAANNDSDTIKSPSIPVLPATAVTSHIQASADAKTPGDDVMAALLLLRNIAFHDVIPKAA